MFQFHDLRKVSPTGHENRSSTDLLPQAPVPLLNRQTKRLAEMAVLSSAQPRLPSCGRICLVLPPSSRCRCCRNSTIQFEEFSNSAEIDALQVITGSIDSRGEMPIARPLHSQGRYRNGRQCEFPTEPQKLSAHPAGADETVARSRRCLGLFQRRDLSRNCPLERLPNQSSAKRDWHSNPALPSPRVSRLGESGTTFEGRVLREHRCRSRNASA